MIKIKGLEQRLLEETIEEFGERIKKYPSLSRYLDASNCIKGVMITGESSDNPFQVLLSLTQRLAEAYRSRRIWPTEFVPNWAGGMGDNSITYSLIRDEKFQPFTNETTGEKVYWIETIFGEISSVGEPTGFYRRLKLLIDEFRKERDVLRDEIVNSESYKNVRKRFVPTDEKTIREMTPDQKNAINLVLRTAYRVEELIRKDRIVELAKKAEEIYDLAARLYEGLRHYKAA